MVRQRSKTPFLFFSRREKKAILSAIREAEKCTSGEIRVHLDRKKIDNAEQRAREIFEKIGMTKTAARNGVLIYLNTHTRQFTLLGDQGINSKVPPTTWQETVRQMEENFRNNRFADGIVAAVTEIGEKLKTHFPHQKNDVNELPDKISYSL